MGGGMRFDKMYCIQKIGMVENATLTHGITEKKEFVLQGVKMKRLLFPFLMSFLFGISFPVISFADDSRSVTILYTGSVKGEIDPCAA